MNESLTQTPPFLETKEYRRFAEFCDACRRYRYIGLCYGPPGVGKTLSGYHYAHWDVVEPVMRTAWDPNKLSVPELARCRTLFYTVSMTTTPKRLELDLSKLLNGLNLTIANSLHPSLEHTDVLAKYLEQPQMAELLIVDEADRLNVSVLEQLRHLYDQQGFGLVLIGMPGLEKRLARYAQLYSRVGFVHQFRTLSASELRFILEQRWRELGLSIDLTDFDDVEAMNAIIRITGGNFRLVYRLLTQIERVLEINSLRNITKEVVEAARESLVIGSWS